MEQRRGRAAACVLGSVLCLAACSDTTPPGRGPAGADRSIAPGSGGARRPNVLLVVMSTARTDRMSLYGHDAPTTPHLESLAARAVVYENCITPATWMLPVHASLFTGLYLRDHGADGATAQRSSTVNGPPALPDRRETLAEILRDAGYLTGGLSNNDWLDSRFGVQQGFDSFGAIPRRDPDGTRLDDGAAASNERVLAWLDDRPDPERPFFYYMNYIEPAMPYDPPEPWDERFLPPGAEEASVAELRGWRYPRELAFMLELPGGEVTPRQFEILRGLYDGELAYLDARIGELLAGLDARDLLEGTVLIVTSDQGEHFGEHGLMHHKMSVYEPLIHVPLLIRHPEVAPARVKSLVQTHDLFPTILALAGIEHRGPHGVRVLPWSDEQGGGRDFVFAEAADPTPLVVRAAARLPGADFSRFARSLRTVRGERYKYIWASDGTRELYDLLEDPTESVDISAREPGIVNRMHDLLLRFDRRDLP
jgi:arylsulfatase A-like enzyme